MMLTTVLEVDKLLQQATEGVDYLRNHFDLFVRTEIVREEYLVKSRNTYEYLERLVNDELIESFENEIRTAYLTYHDLDRLLKFLDIINGRVGDLTEALWKFYDDEQLHDLDSADGLNEDNLMILDEIRGIAKYATVKNYFEKPYFLISYITSRFMTGNKMESVPISNSLNDEHVDHETEPQLTGPNVKLKWACKPAVAGYIITELIRAGYIEPPITNGELSYAKLAKICNQIFDITGKDGNPTTLDYLKKSVNPESNSLPDTKRAKLRLPDLSDLK